MFVFLYSDMFVLLANALVLIATCVGDVLPMCIVAGRSRPETKVQLGMALLLLHYDFSTQTINIEVDLHFHFTQQCCFRLGPPQPSTKHPSDPHILMSSSLLAVTTVSSMCMCLP